MNHCDEPVSAPLRFTLRSCSCLPRGVMITPSQPTQMSADHGSAGESGGGGDDTGAG